MKKLLIFGAAIFLAVIFFCAGWLITVHHLEIWEDRPARQVYVTDMFGLEWVYDSSPVEARILY